MLPFVLLFETFGFTEFGVGFLERNVQWISWLLTLFLPLLSLDLELAVMPVMHSSLNCSTVILHNSAMFSQSLAAGAGIAINAATYRVCARVQVASHIAST